MNVWKQRHSFGIFHQLFHAVYVALIIKMHFKYMQLIQTNNTTILLIYISCVEYYRETPFSFIVKESNWSSLTKSILLLLCLRHQHKYVHIVVTNKTWIVDVALLFFLFLSERKHQFFWSIRWKKALLTKKQGIQDICNQ